MYQKRVVGVCFIFRYFEVSRNLKKQQHGSIITKLTFDESALCYDKVVHNKLIFFNV